MSDTDSEQPSELSDEFVETVLDELQTDNYADQTIQDRSLMGYNIDFSNINF